MDDWPGTDQLGVLVTVASLALAVLYAGGTFDATDALAGLIVLAFGILYERRIRVTAIPLSGFVVSQFALAWFLVVAIIVVGAASLVLGVTNEPAWPGSPWLDTPSDLRWADFTVAVLTFFVGSAVACFQVFRVRTRS